MSIAAARKRRRQQANGNRHLAKIGRPGTPKKVSVEKSTKRLHAHMEKLKKIALNKARSKK